ncbi:MAG: OmpA family protein [Hellea sp.]|nr:OmpA family protein [Hellea sp.]
MSSDDKNKTVFRPSPLAAPKKTSPASTGPSESGDIFSSDRSWDAASDSDPTPSGTVSQTQFVDNVPIPDHRREDRNPLMAFAAPVLALSAAVQSGRLSIPLMEFHKRAAAAIKKFETAVQSFYPDTIYQRAKYAVCATVDDVAQNLPGTDGEGAQWAQRNMVVTFFRENIGGDRFLNFVQDMLKDPASNRDLIELYHSCLAAGFEGRFRIMPDGHSRKQEYMSKLYSSMAHVRSLSDREIVNHWKGVDAPRKQPSFWGVIALVASIVAGVCFLIYFLFNLVLMSTASESNTRVSNIFPEGPVMLNRVAPVYRAPPTTTELRLKKFLESEIQLGLVEIHGNRVRTSIGTMFAPASDRLTEGRQTIIERIGQAAESEEGQIIVQGHTDSDPISSIRYQNNFALSEARARTVANIIRSQLSDPSRVSIQGLGDTQPLVSNATPQGKAKNRRVEIIFEQAL